MRGVAGGRGVVTGEGFVSEAGGGSGAVASGVWASSRTWPPDLLFPTQAPHGKRTTRLDSISVTSTMSRCQEGECPPNPEALPCGVMPDFEPGQGTYVFRALQQEAVCASPLEVLLIALKRDALGGPVCPKEPHRDSCIS